MNSVASRLKTNKKKEIKKCEKDIALPMVTTQSRFAL